MNLGRNLRRRLGWKLFFSYLLVIFVGVFVLAAAVEFAIPAAFNRHMGGMMGEIGMMGAMGGMDGSLFAGFRAAFNEALLLGGVSAVIAAGAASLLLARRVLAPVQALTEASRQIAAGHYSERVPEQIRPGQEDELGRLALSFNKMAAQLEETEAIRRQLIGDVAHELRTPLTTIKGSIEALLDGVLPANADTFRQVHHEADRLQRLVDDLQELSRVEARAFALDLQTVSLELIIRGVSLRMKAQFEGKEVSLQVEIPTDLPLVLADGDRLTQILINLLGNALQYTPAGGAVLLRCAPARRKDLVERFPDWGEVQLPAGGWVLISITDTGIGISPEHLPHVFDRFYRVDKSRSRVGGGSGIGLTIAKHLVEAHGGRIKVESEGTGKGSTFLFCLPRRAPSGISWR